eukprot:5259132-Alexandrium_andersonii.AAC.1
MLAHWASTGGWSARRSSTCASKGLGASPVFSGRLRMQVPWGNWQIQKVLKKAAWRGREADPAEKRLSFRFPEDRRWKVRLGAALNAAYGDFQDWMKHSKGRASSQKLFRE